MHLSLNTEDYNMYMCIYIYVYTRVCLCASAHRDPRWNWSKVDTIGSESDPTVLTRILSQILSQMLAQILSRFASKKKGGIPENFQIPLSVIACSSGRSAVSVCSLGRSLWLCALRVVKNKQQMNAEQFLCISCEHLFCQAVAANRA